MNSSEEKLKKVLTVRSQEILKNVNLYTFWKELS